jgi:glycosyltransferase involved in cell wall biosynthesis
MASVFGKGNTFEAPGILQTTEVKEIPKMKDSIKVSLVIPCFNESRGVVKTLEEILAHTSKLGGLEIIFVNDGSTDDTGEILSEQITQLPQVRYLQNHINLGYGASLKKGICSAKGEIIVITDADGTYPAEEIPELLHLLKNCDMVVGARIGKNVRIPIIRRPAKWLLLKYARWMARADIKDLNSGLRAFRKSDAFKFFHLLPQGFSFTSTITLAMHIDGFNVVYHPINYRKRLGKSSIRPIRDTFAFFTLVLKTTMYFRPLQVFGSLSVLFLLTSLLVGISGKIYFGTVPDVATVSLVSTGLIFLGLGLIGDLINTSFRILRSQGKSD